MFGDGDLTLRTLKLWSTLEISGVLLEFADGGESASCLHENGSAGGPLASVVEG